MYTCPDIFFDSQIAASFNRFKINAARFWCDILCISVFKYYESSINSF